MKRLWLLLLIVVSCVKPEEKESEKPAPEDNGPLTIAFITDTHYSSQTSTASNQMRKCIEDINSLDGISFVLVGGDITNIGSDAQLQGAKAELDKLKYPYWVVPGNHDAKWSESGATTFAKTFGYERFEFEKGGYRFIGCPSGPEVRMAPALVSRSDLAWLKSLSPGKPMIFLNHYPLNSGMSNWFEVRREILRLRCRFVIGGHVHSNGTYDYDGLPGMTGRTSQSSSGEPGYNIIKINNGLLTVSERVVSDELATTRNPWLRKDLEPVQDNLSYDADGLPVNYSGFKFSDNATYPQVSVVWSKVEDANIISGFATDGTTAWYTTIGGNVCAVAVNNGSALWTRQFDGKIFATPSVGGGVVAFTCTNGSVYALNASTGADKWEYPGNAKVACPVIYGDAVYSGSGDGGFRAFNLSDGKMLWKCTGIGGFCDAAPYVDDSQIITGSWGGTLYSIERATGKLQWKWERSPSFMYCPGACTPLKSGDKVFIACPDKITYCVDAKKGTTLYTVDGGRESLAMSKDKSIVYVKVMEKYALAFNVSDGSIIWNVETGLGKDIGTSALSTVEDLVLIPSDKGYILALDAATGAMRWRHRVGTGLVNPLSAWTYDGKIRILASSMDGRLELLEVSE